MRTAGLSIIAAALRGTGAGGAGDGGRGTGEGGASREARSVARSWRGAGVCLVLLCAAVYGPGLWAIPPIDRDESRFAQASREMYEGGEYAVPRVQGRARLNKPPLIYWLQCGALAVFGDEGRKFEGIWVYRLPSVLAAVGSVLLTWRLGLRMFDPRAAWLGAALLAVCPMVVWDAHQARADQVLMLTVVGGEWALWGVWRGAGGGIGVPPMFRSMRRWPGLRHGKSSAGDGRSSAVRRCHVQAVLFWVFIGAGVMVKGPVAPMIVGLTVLMVCVVTRRWGWVWRLRPVLGVVIVGAMVVPWVWSVAREVGWGNYLAIVREETLGRSAGAKEGHWGPPGYHLVLLAVLFWPGSLLTAGAVGRAWGKGVGWRGSRVGGRRAAELFLLAWVLPSWIVFELVSTKLPHYTMPLYPALALLSGRAVLGAAGGGLRGWSGRGARIGAGLWWMVGWAVLLPSVAVGVVLMLGGGTSGTYESKAGPPSAASGLLDFAAGSILAVTAIWCLANARHALRDPRWTLRAQLLGVGVAVCSLGIITHALLPRFVTVSADAAGAVEADGGRAAPIALQGYQEDSLVFLTRGRAQRVETGAVGAWLEAHPGGYALISSAHPDAAALTEGRRRGSYITGFNYSNGRGEHLYLIGPGDESLQFPK